MSASTSLTAEARKLSPAIPLASMAMHTCDSWYSSSPSLPTWNVERPPESTVATRSSRIDIPEPFQKPIGSTRQLFEISPGSVEMLPASS